MDKPEKHRKSWLKYVVILVAALIIIGIVWVIFAGRAKSEVPAEVISAKATTSFPLYYPQPLPDGFSSTSNSLNVTDGALMFNVTDRKGNAVVVTQQPRPQLTEEVTKTKQFSTPIGNAFLAQLNGRTVGFIYTEKTLIIVSSTNEVDDDDLVKLLSSLQKI